MYTLLWLWLWLGAASAQVLQDHVSKLTREPKDIQWGYIKNLQQTRRLIWQVESNLHRRILQRKSGKHKQPKDHYLSG